MYAFSYVYISLEAQKLLSTTGIILAVSMDVF